MKIGYFCNPWNIGHEHDYRDILNGASRRRDVKRTRIGP